MKEKPGLEGLVRIDLPKSAYLLLTYEEYRRGILRGKTERRRLANEARLEVKEILVKRTELRLGLLNQDTSCSETQLPFSLSTVSELPLGLQPVKAAGIHPQQMKRFPGFSHLLYCFSLFLVL